MELDGVISTEQCKKVLESYTGSKNFVIKSCCVSPIQSQLEGLLAEQYFLKIQYQIDDEEKTAQFFVKILCKSNPVMLDIAKSIYAFEKESFFYTTFLSCLEHQNIKADFVPKSYFSEPSTIVLEDLSLRDFRGTTKNVPLDLKHCKKCLEVLARFHASAVAYNKKSVFSEAFLPFNDQTYPVLEDKVFSEEETAGSKFMKCSLRGLFSLIDVIPEQFVDKEKFKVTLQEALEKVLAFRMEDLSPISAVLHGDLWSNNFLFKYENDEIVDCILIDFQILKYGPPSFDVLQFIFTNTRKKFRDQHLKELLDQYYSAFRRTITDCGFGDFSELSEEEFHLACNEFLLPAKIMAVMDRSITFMVDTYHSEAAEDEDEFKKYLFEDRGKYIVAAYEQNKDYRELITEDLYELRDILFSDQARQTFKY